MLDLIPRLEDIINNAEAVFDSKEEAVAAAKIIIDAITLIEKIYSKGIGETQTITILPPSKH